MFVTPLNSVPYTGPPLDHSQQNETNPVLKNHPSMVFLPQRTTVKELSNMLSDTKNGIAVSGGTANGQIGLLIDSSDIPESADGFLFRVALPDIEKHEKIKCDVQENGTITIHGATSTCAVFYSWPAHVDPTTLDHMLDNDVLEGLSRKNRFNMDWTDQVPIAVAPLNSVSYMCPPFDLPGKNALLNHPTTVRLPESTTVEELNKILSFAKKGIAVSGSAAGGVIRPLIGSFDVSDNDGGFLFCVTLPSVEKNEKFKCDVQEDETITIHEQYLLCTGEKKGHSRNMVFDMHTESSRPPGDLLVSCSWPAHVDPTTLEHVLDNGILEGLSRRNRSDMADQAPISVAPLKSFRQTGPPFDSSKNQPLNRMTMLMLNESTTVEELNQILSIKGLAVESGAAGDLLEPLIGAFDISDNDDRFFFSVALPGVEKNEKFKCAVQEDGTVQLMDH